MSTKTKDENADLQVEGSFLPEGIVVEIRDSDREVITERVYDWGDVVERRSQEMDFEHHLNAETDFFINVKFTWDGVSASCYAEDGSAEAESWFTWEEVSRRKDLHPDFTYSLVL